MRTSRDSDLWSLLNPILMGSSETTQFAQIHELTASCMASRGWEYVPPPTDSSVQGIIRTVGELRRYREANGYGINIVPEDDGFNRETDPNQAYVDGLSETERTQYFLDLNGDNPDAADAQGMPPPDSDGCYPQAEREVRMGAPLEANEQLRSMISPEAVLNDPRYQEAMKDWSACMSEQGYDHDDPGEAQDSFRDAQPSEGEAARELRVAGADVECYISHVHPVQRTIEMEMLTEAAERFPELARYIDTQS